MHFWTFWKMLSNQLKSIIWSFPKLNQKIDLNSWFVLYTKIVIVKISKSRMIANLKMKVTKILSLINTMIHIYFECCLDKVFINYITTYVHSLYDISLNSFHLGFCLFWWLVTRKQHKSPERHFNVIDHAYFSQENYKNVRMTQQIFHY